MIGIWTAVIGPREQVTADDVESGGRRAAANVEVCGNHDLWEWPSPSFDAL